MSSQQSLGVMGTYSRGPSAAGIPPAVLAAQRTFRTLLDAIARPGTIYTLPHADERAPELGICMALLDYQVTYAIANPGPHSETAIADREARIGLETGCTRVAIPEASFVLTYGPLPQSAWNEVRRGTLAFPDQGATIIYVVTAIGDAVPGAVGTNVTLTGPGIARTRTLMVSGLNAAEFARLASVNRDYPMGVDAILLDMQWRVACIPRSSQIAAEEA